MTLSSLSRDSVTHRTSNKKDHILLRPGTCMKLPFPDIPCDKHVRKISIRAETMLGGISIHDLNVSRSHT